MQIVIDIPEETYKKICGYSLHHIDFCYTEDVALIAVQKGTPLSKGHGALKDADEVFAVMERNFDMQDLYLPIHFKQFALDEAKTIVEADKEVDE